MYRYTETERKCVTKYKTMAISHFNKVKHIIQLVIWSDDHSDGRTSEIYGEASGKLQSHLSWTNGQNKYCLVHLNHPDCPPPSYLTCHYVPWRHMAKSVITITVNKLFEVAGRGLGLTNVILIELVEIYM